MTEYTSTGPVDEPERAEMEPELCPMCLDDPAEDTPLGKMCRRCYELEVENEKDNGRRIKRGQRIRTVVVIRNLKNLKFFI